MLMEQHLQFLYGKIAQHPSIVDAIVLCKTWIRQRHFDEVCKNCCYKEKDSWVVQALDLAATQRIAFPQTFTRTKPKEFSFEFAFFCTIAYARSLPLVFLWMLSHTFHNVALAVVVIQLNFAFFIRNIYTSLFSLSGFSKI